MITEEDFKSAFIAKLAGISESKTDLCPTCNGKGTIEKPFGEGEVVWNSGSKMTRTIDFPDGSISDAVVRYYRKDGSLYSFSEYKDSKKHGVSKKFFANGDLQEDIKFEEGKRTWAKEYTIYGMVIKNYKKGKFHGYFEYYSINNTKGTYLFKACTIKNGTPDGLESRFDSNHNKLEDILYVNGYLLLHIVYTKGKGTIITPSHCSNYYSYDHIKKFNETAYTKYGTHIIKYKYTIDGTSNYKVVKK